jgi:hypothetical protein
MNAAAMRSPVRAPITWAMVLCSSMLLAPTKTNMPAKKTWMPRAAR